MSAFDLALHSVASEYNSLKARSRSLLITSGATTGLSKAVAPKNDPVARTRTSSIFASVRSAILSATRIASRSNPEPSVGTMITLYIRASSIDYGFLQCVFWEAIVNTAVPITGIVLSILAGSLHSSSVRWIRMTPSPL